jgi:hypothetical protein
MKRQTRIGFWNIRTMLEASRLSQVLKEMIYYKPDLLGLSETTLNGSGEFMTASCELLLYSDRALGEKHAYGVGLILNKSLKKSLIEWRAVSESILIARLNTRRRKLTTVQCYAPTNETTMEEKEDFCGLLETTLHQIRQSEITIMMGDFNLLVPEFYI